MVRKVSVLRRVEHHERVQACRPLGIARHDGLCAWNRTPDPLEGHRNRQRGAVSLGHRRARPRARRRRGARLVRARRRRAGHRQVHAPAPDVPGDVQERPRALCIGRGVAPADQAPRRAAAYFLARAVYPLRNRYGPDHQRNRADGAGYSHRGLHSDGLQARPQRRARRHDPDKRVRDEPDAVREEQKRHHLHRRPRQQGGYACRPENP